MHPSQLYFDRHICSSAVIKKSDRLKMLSIIWLTTPVRTIIKDGVLVEEVKRWEGRGPRGRRGARGGHAPGTGPQAPRLFNVNKCQVARESIETVEVLRAHTHRPSVRRL
ncbi:hypothetical protein EVAR_36130_1 [Eumeta japonica]|uniref:Uncharacterized protein n=1 Tax=Eumeta variegata TaxID=151549 RepID=A0A4C1X155_EUMVA|nr:hypothetical protein EVAR_36130_1 [Eumeta japonica]